MIAAVTPKLPANFMDRTPTRALLTIPLVAAAAGLFYTIAFLDLPFYVDIALALCLGNLYGIMMFHGHEIGHGAIVKSPTLQRILMYPLLAAFCLPPRFWQMWHNRAHHNFTNKPDLDPDNFGSLVQYEKDGAGGRFALKLAPGSNHILSFFYMLTFFFGQGQHVLWMKSRKLPTFEGAALGRFKIESLLLIAGWIALGVWIGPYNSLFAIIIPFVFSNAMLLSYIMTNHMLNPLSEERDSLTTSLGLKSPWIVDFMHLNFSHHIEHHIFPSVATHKLPAARAAVRETFPADYRIMTHPQAIKLVFTSPRLYEDNNNLIHPISRRRVAIETLHKK